MNYLSRVFSRRSELKRSLKNDGLNEHAAIFVAYTCATRKTITIENISTVRYFYPTSLKGASSVIYFLPSRAIGPSLKIKVRFRRLYKSVSYCTERKYLQNISNKSNTFNSALCREFSTFSRNENSSVQMRNIIEEHLRFNDIIRPYI